MVRTSWLPSGLTPDPSNSLQISSQHVSDFRRNYLEYVTIQLRMVSVVDSVAVCIFYTHIRFMKGMYGDSRET